MYRERTIGWGEDWLPTRGGLLLPAAYAPPRRLTAVDLFAGAGGFSLGMHQAGWHVAAALEWDPVAAATYLLNLGAPGTVVHVGSAPPPGAPRKQKKWWSEFGGCALPACEVVPAAGSGWISGQPDQDPCEHFWMCDVGELRGAELLAMLGLDVGDVDAVVGGPPCQGFSIAGQRDPNDPRNSLVFEFARLVLEIRPKTMVMENVPGLLNMVTPQGVPVIDALCRVLADGGFSTYDALRKSLAGTDARAALRRDSAGKPGDVDDQLEDDQLDLFAQEAV